MDFGSVILTDRDQERFLWDAQNGLLCLRLALKEYMALWQKVGGVLFIQSTFSPLDSFSIWGYI